MAITPNDRKEIDGPTGNLGTGGGGSNDSTSGGGAGSGTPDAETAARAGEGVTRGDVKEDRAKLFPEAKGQSKSQDAPDRRLDAIPPPKGG